MSARAGHGRPALAKLARREGGAAGAMDLLDGETRVHDYALERQMMLSDGVFAIALTLLALELRPPQGWDGSLHGLLRGIAPALFGYFWAFFAIATFWATHRASWGRLRRTDFVLSALGLITLGLVTLIPFACRVYIAGDADPGLTGLYLGLIAAVAVMNALSWTWAALRPGLMQSTIGPASKVTVGLSQLIVAPAMTACGLLSGYPGLHWLWLLMFPIGMGAGRLRRQATKVDAARAGRARSHG